MSKKNFYDIKRILSKFLWFFKFSNFFSFTVVGKEMYWCIQMLVAGLGFPSPTEFLYLLNKPIKLKPHKFTVGTFLFEHCPVVAYGKQ